MDSESEEDNTFFIPKMIAAIFGGFFFGHTIGEALLYTQDGTYIPKPDVSGIVNAVTRLLGG
jgi:hypothetical protein